MAGVFAVAKQAADAQANAAAGRGAAVYQLDTSAVRDRSGFFDQVVAVFPLDPPLVRFKDVWDALADSLWEGLYQLRVEEVAIVWTGVGVMRRSAPAEFGIARQVIEHLTQELGDPDLTVGRPVDVIVYLTN